MSENSVTQFGYNSNRNLFFLKVQQNVVFAQLSALMCDIISFLKSRMCLVSEKLFDQEGSG